MYVYTAICKNFEPSRIYNDISLYLGVHLFLGAIFRKRCFPCDISMELPSGCKSCMLSHMSHLTSDTSELLSYMYIFWEVQNFCKLLYLYVSHRPGQIAKMHLS